MKMKKLLALLPCTLAACSACVFSACTPASDGTDPSGVKEYVMEAEYINLDGVAGAGISSDQQGVNMIYGQGTAEEKNLGWSNGYFVGYTYVTDLELNFEFTAAAAGNATIVVRLGSELGDLSLSPSLFDISLNGKSIRYNCLVEGSELATMKFTDCTIATNAALQEGTNKITLKVKENTLRRGTETGAPVVDCVKIKTDSALTWTDATNNITKRDNPFDID